MGLTERASNKPTVDYRGVRFTADRVALLDGDHEVVTIPLDNIRDPDATKRAIYSPAAHWSDDRGLDARTPLPRARRPHVPATAP